ncbi:MAG: 2-octaprenyl-6-methoxyphenyl hydroxylase [Pseudomonadota bacterium]
MSDSYDIVIAGGGMVGSSLALALAPLGLSIAMVEAIPRGAAEQPSFDERSTALSRSSQRTFEALGLWPEVVAASTPIKHIRVSDRGRFGFARIDADQQGVEALGYVVINRVLGGVLQKAIAGCGNVDVICPARIEAVKTNTDAVTAVSDIDSGQRSLTGRLLVAADGARSQVRDMLGIGVEQKSYQQHAVIGNLMTERPLAGVAFERFTEQGPLALLPITDGRAAFVWMVDDADQALSMSNDEFLDALQTLFGWRLGRFSRLGKRIAYPLTLSKALRLNAPRAVVVGNAAHGLHPVAAQGFNMGLRDVATLADCISDEIADGDIGGAAMLARYAEWRRADHQKLVRFTDGLVGLFADARGPVRAARNLGMLGFDLVPGVRKLFAQHTMGLAGRLPRLSRGVPLA